LWYSIYPVNKFFDSRFNFIPSTKEHVINNGVFKPAPQFLDFVKVWTVWWQKNKLQAFTVFFQLSPATALRDVFLHYPGS